MSIRRTCAARMACATVLAVLLSTAAFAEEKADQAAGGGMPLPKPGPEHAMLAKWAGKWNSVTTMSQGPMKMTWAGTCDARVTAGGLWMETDYKSTDPKVPFEGHEIFGYDPNAKKFVGSWVDSWSTAITPFESEWNADKKQFRSTMTTNGPDGQPVRMIMVIDVPDEDHHTMRAWMGGDETAEPMMVAEYTRAGKKASSTSNK